VSKTDREERLAAELEVMRALAKESSILEFESQGDPPDRYTITLRGRGIKRASAYRDETEYVDRHECEIRLGYGFPDRPPEVRWLTPIFHPNISYSGYVNLKDCGLSWEKDLTLDVICERIWDLARLAWIDLDAATNFSAKNWIDQQHKITLPVDTRPLRDQGGPSASNVIQYQRGPAGSPTLSDEGILYIDENTPTPELPQPRPRPRPMPRRRDDDDVLYIGDD
jgi:ubiquitin-protein ligase